MYSTYLNCYRGGYNSLLFVGPVIFWSVVYTLPKFFELRHAHVKVHPEMNNFTEASNATLFSPDAVEYTLKVVPTAMRKSKLYVRAYLIWTNLIMQIFLPFVALITLNYKIYQTIKRSEKTLRQHGSEAGTNNKATSLRKREVTLSKISIYITFVFLFCHSVRIIPNGYELIYTYTRVTSCIRN